MDTSLNIMMGTAVLGIIGLVYFFMSQTPAPAKQRSKGGDLKPRGEPEPAS